MARVKEADVWCKPCNTYYGQIFSVEVREGFYINETEPSPLPKKCSLCDAVVTRK